MEDVVVVSESVQDEPHCEQEASPYQQPNDRFQRRLRFTFRPRKQRLATVLALDGLVLNFLRATGAFLHKRALAASLRAFRHHRFHRQ